MERSQKITAVASAVVVAGLLALAAPPLVNAAAWAGDLLGADAQPAAATETAAPVSDGESPADGGAGLVDLGDGISVPAGGPGDCTTNSRINIQAADGEPSYGTLLGDLVEMGPRAGAPGETVLDANGELLAYKVEPNDNLIAIGERFCVDFVTVGAYNHRFGPTAIQPGDVLILRPDPTVPWFDYNSPSDVEGPFVTAPYRQAIGEMRSAAREGDLAAAQAVWDDYLADVMGPTAAVVGQAISDGDLELLRAMFP